MPFSDTEKINAAGKLALQLLSEASADPGQKFWYNEARPWAPIIPPNKIWSSFYDIPGAVTPAAADAAVVANPTIMEKGKIRLTLQLDSNNRMYWAREIYGDASSAIYENAIMPALIQTAGGPSAGYIARLYHGDPDTTGGELTTTQHGGAGGAPAWEVFYPIIGVRISTDQAATFKTYYDTNGLYLVVYRYIGATGGGGGVPVNVWIETGALAPGDHVLDGVNWGVQKSVIRAVRVIFVGTPSPDWKAWLYVGTFDADALTTIHLTPDSRDGDYDLTVDRQYNPGAATVKLRYTDNAGSATAKFRIEGEERE